MAEQQSLFGSNGGGSNGGDGETLTLAQFAQRAYLDYAVSVVKGRALPDVSDGQKPVQRRILYAMNEMGLGGNARPVKSARVVGDVLGKYHPHGDQAAYEALVRMAQDFSLRYPLIDGQGNFGSRDGDGAAAMRYTEARLTPIARLLLDELDEGTVDFTANYDGSLQEPLLLPARLPMVLLNGASGIAVGMATEIPSHNLREVVAALQLVLKDPKVDTKELLRAMPGPDFPGGSQVISSPEEIRETYSTGRGSLKVRAQYKFEELARGQWQLVITELPPGVAAARVEQEIAELTDPKVKVGKKSLTPEQQNLRQMAKSLLDRTRDESDKNAAVRFVVEPATSKIDRQELVNFLLAHTSLESNVPVNLVMIGRDGRPRQKSLVSILAEFVEFRVETVRRRTSHRLNKVQDRIHILEGRQLVLLSIDKVIRLIRNSDEPKPELIKAFKLTERQADDILDLRLRQLARLEGIKIEQELADLRKDEASLQKLLGSDAALRKQVGKEFDEDAKKFGPETGPHADKRRTLIEAAERAAVETKLIDEPVTVIVSEMGFARARGGHGLDRQQLTFKQGDALYDAFECRTVDHLIAVGSNGRVYSVPVSQLPSRGDGTPVTSQIELEAGTRLVGYAAGPANQSILLSTSAGFGFACQLENMVSRQKGGKQFITVDEGVVPLRPALVDLKAKDDPRIDHLVACVSGKGRLLVFDAPEIKLQPGGGRGVTLMGLDDGEVLVGATPCGSDGIVVSGTSKTGKETEHVLRGRELDSHKGHRARKGTLIKSGFKPATLRKAGKPSAA